MTYKLVQNKLGEYGVVDEVGDQYPVGTKGRGWGIQPVYWTKDKAEAAAAKVRHEIIAEERRNRNTWKGISE